MIERVEAELGWEFMQIYGLTETSPLLTVNRAPREYDGLEPSERARRLSRAGVPAIGVRMRVDEQGEVLARSNHVFHGYWEQPDATDAAIVDGWFHTGDGGELDGAYVVIADRKKDVIISGGENVSSIEVEDCLFQHPAVAEAAVIGVPDDKWGETVKALVVLRPGQDGVDEADAHRPLSRPHRPLQVPDLGGDPRRARPHRHRQAPEVQAPRPLLGGPGPPGQLIGRRGTEAARSATRVPRPMFPGQPSRPGSPSEAVGNPTDSGNGHVRTAAFVDVP